MTEANGGDGMDTKTDPKTQAEAEVQKQQEALAQLLTRAEQGDQTVLPALRAVLDASPALWRHYGDLALQAEAALGVLAAGKNLLLGESLQRKLAAMKEELAGKSPSPLERLLVERVTATWLQTNYYDALVAQNKGASDTQSRRLQGLQDAAHRRHLTALRALATVRKLLTPAPSPIEVASRLDRTAAGARRDRDGVAGTVPVRNKRSLVRGKAPADVAGAADQEGLDGRRDLALLAPCLRAVDGAEPHGHFNRTDDRVRHLLAAAGLDQAATVLVSDRGHDGPW
jgi:hypothetical protein